MPRQNTTSKYPKVLRNKYGKVRIYQGANRGDWEVYTVTWSVGKTRIRKCFADELAASNHAENVLEQFEHGHPLAGTLTTSDAIYYDACRKRLGGVPLMTAVEFYLINHGDVAEGSQVMLTDARNAFLKDIKSQGNSVRDIQTVRSHLGDFCDHFAVSISSIKAADLDDYLQRKNWSNCSRKNVRGTICRLWAWAFKKGVLPKHRENEAAKSLNYKAERSGSPGIFTPDEMATLLSAVPDIWLPYFAIGGFAGLRSAEIVRLTWADINLDEKVIVLSSAVTKTRKRRVVNMPDNLVEWLRVSAVEKTGPVCPHARPNKATSAAASESGVKWVDNGLRHSSISYQMAIVRDAEKVSEQHGNSSSEVQASYKANVLEKDATRWFSIIPDVPKNNH